MRPSHRAQLAPPTQDSRHHGPFKTLAPTALHRVKQAALSRVETHTVQSGTNSFTMRWSSSAFRSGQPAMLMLPGLLEQAPLYDRMLTQLTAMAPMTAVSVQFSGFEGASYAEAKENARHFTVKHHALEAQAAFDEMMNLWAPDPRRTIVGGHCYGALLAAEMATREHFGELILQTPVLYPDYVWNQPRIGSNSREIFEYYKHPHSVDDNDVLSRLSQFHGHVRFIHHGEDDIVKPVMTDSFRHALVNAQSIEDQTLPGLRHGCPEQEAQAGHVGDWCEVVNNVLSDHALTTVERGGSRRSMRQVERELALDFGIQHDTLGSLSL